jgi:hypothetical protein
MVTIFVGAPPIKARIGMEAPVAAFNGIFTFSCQIPTMPGANPENWMSPKTPAIATQTEGCLVRQVLPSEVGTARVAAAGFEGAG